MFHDIFQYLADPPSMTSLLVKTVAGLMAAGIGASVMLPVVRRRMFAEPQRDGISDHVLFDRVLADGQTIACTDGTLLRCIALGGADLSGMTGDDQEALFRRRKAWVDGLEGHSAVSVMVVTQRRREERLPDAGRFDNPELSRLHQIYQSRFARGFRNTHTLVLSVGGGERAARVSLNTAVEHCLSTLADFRPMPLEVGDPGAQSPLLGYWASLLNPVRSPTTGLDASGYDIGNLNTAGWDPDEHMMPGTRLADSVATGTIKVGHGAAAARINVRAGDDLEHDDNGIVEFADAPGGESRFMAAIGISRYGPNSSTEITDAILSVPAEMMMVHWIEAREKPAAIALLDDKKKKAGGVRTSNNAMAQYDFAIDEVQKGSALCRYQGHVFVYGEDRLRLLRNLDLVRRAFGAFENRCVFCRDAVELLFMSLFPPQMFWERPVDLLSGNVADGVSLETPAIGHSRCDWGDRPVSLFPTLRGTTYSFCWHDKPGPLTVGHTVVFGSTGAGKTFLTNFLATASLGYDDTHVFIFDRFDGAYVPTRAFGGAYLTFDNLSDGDGKTGCALNPFQMDLNDPVVRSWMIVWLRDLVMSHTDTKTEEHITRALHIMAPLPIEDRSMHELVRNLPNDMKGIEDLKRFTDGGSYDGRLSAPRDTLSVEGVRHVGFDFTRILEDEVLVRTVLPYIMFRIDQAMAVKNTPYLMLFDETHALMQNDAMRKWVIMQLQEARKKRGVVVMCFQRVSSLIETAGTEIISLTPTRIVLPNPNAGEHEYRSVLDLSWTDLEIVRGRHPSVAKATRYALVKRDGVGSVVLDTDMSERLRTENGISLVPLFASGKEDADRARHYEQYRAGDPQWVGDYLRASNEQVARRAAE